MQLVMLIGLRNKPTTYLDLDIGEGWLHQFF